MKLVTLLHFYQPANQQSDILKRIVNECYIPVTRGLLDISRAKIVVNISGCLTELLTNQAYVEVLDNLRLLAKTGKVEFTASAKFHAFLPLIPRDEVVRQVELNNEINRKVFGDLYNPVGFFSPEMAVSPELLSIVADLGYKWVAAPQLSCPTGLPDFSKIYKDRKSGLNILFRNKRVSSLILSALCKNGSDLVKETADLRDDLYWAAVMDAETFGHHRIGHEQALFGIQQEKFIEPITASALFENVPSDCLASLDEIRSCTWTNEEQDFWLDKEKTKKTQDKAFILWKDPSNPIHRLQWELFNLVLKETSDYPNKYEPSWITARLELDRALGSDQFWWASAKPWWSLEMVEQGAYELKKVLITLDSQLRSVKEAEHLYQSILEKAFEWQRTGYIRKRNVENSSTYLKDSFSKRAPTEWYNQIILEFEDEIKKAAAQSNFEAAIKWRDAVLKLKMGTDIYDVLHVVDELWTVRSIPSVKPFLSHNWEEFSEFAKKNFINSYTKGEFQHWQKERGFK